MPKNKKRTFMSRRASDSSSDSEDEENIVLDPKEYKELLKQLFPSQYMMNQTKSSQKKNKKSKKAATKTKSGAKQEMDILFQIVPPSRGSKLMIEEESEDEEYDSDDETSDEDYETETSEDDEESEDYDEEESDEDEEDEEEEAESEEESEEEDEEEDEEDEDEGCDEEESNHKTRSKSKKKRKTITDDEVYEELTEAISRIEMGAIQNKKTEKQLKEFKTIIDKNKKSGDKKKKHKNAKRYLELISSKKNFNDVKFFKESLTCKEQEDVLNSLKEVNDLTSIDKPYRLKILECEDIPDKFKAIAMKKINAMKVIAEGGGEYHKLKCWVDTFMRIPFGKISTLPIDKTNNREEIQKYIQSSQDILDKAVYGMKDAKVQFMQMLAQWISNPTSVGNAIAIKGPMGTGKTTLIKEGVSKLLNREFAFIALGGATDSSFLEGHSYTYEGSTYGKIIDILIQCKSSNPVIYFDELDKVSDTPRGEEIIGILTHLTDTTQNDKFHDKYFSEIDFDLSKCLFIFSYNDESKVNPILKDRMYNIETKGYSVDEKIIICNSYLVPKLEKELDMESGSIKIDESVLRYIVEKFTGDEKGVRNLKRCLEVIYSKLNLFNLMGSNMKLFGDDIIEGVEFPYSVTRETVDKVITKQEKSVSHLNMYL